MLCSRRAHVVTASPLVPCFAVARRSVAPRLQAVHLGLVEIARSIRTGGFYIGLGDF